VPDRISGVASSIYVDAPTLTVPATVTVTNPAGTAIITAGAVDAHGGGRFGRSLSAGDLSTQGVYDAVFTGANAATKAIEFTVGPAVDGGLMHWDIRLQVARQQGLAIESKITDYDAGVITDMEMAGGPGNYINRWLALHPDAGPGLMGKARRVVDFNGSAFQLSSPFEASPASDAKYALFMLDIREVDAALRLAYRELAPRTRVGFVSGPFTFVDGPTVAGHEHVIVTLPDWITHVDTAWTSVGAEIPSSNWKLAPGRVLIMRDQKTTEDGGITVGSTITLRGQRRCLPPVFDDSIVDMESRALIARATIPLMASRSGGAGVDLKEHLRRLAVAQQEWDLSLQHASGRPASGSRIVIP
jgi:hypothetical protein